MRVADGLCTESRELCSSGPREHVPHFLCSPTFVTPGDTPGRYEVKGNLGTAGLWEMNVKLGVPGLSLQFESRVKAAESLSYFA